MQASFEGAVGIYNFRSWGRDIEKLEGTWSYSSGSYVPNDKYIPCGFSIYSVISYGPILEYHADTHEYSATWGRALPIYKFE